MHIRIYTFFFSGAILVAFLAAASFTFAQTQDTSSSSASSTVLLQESTSTATSTDKLSPAASSTEGVPALAALSSESQLRIINLAANISNKSEAYASRLSIIADRAESRMQKLESEGYEVSNIRNYLSEARGSLQEARDALQGIDVLVSQFVTSAEYQSAWEGVRNAFVGGKSGLEAAKAHLVNAVDEMYRVQIQDIRSGVPQDASSSTPDAAATTTETL